MSDWRTFVGVGIITSVTLSVVAVALEIGPFLAQGNVDMAVFMSFASVLITSLAAIGTFSLIVFSVGLYSSLRETQDIQRKTREVHEETISVYGRYSDVLEHLKVLATVLPYIAEEFDDVDEAEDEQDRPPYGTKPFARRQINMVRISLSMLYTNDTADLIDGYRDILGTFSSFDDPSLLTAAISRLQSLRPSGREEAEEIKLLVGKAEMMLAEALVHRKTLLGNGNN